MENFKSYSMGIIFCVIYVSIDRYIAITDPLRYTTRITPKVIGSLICCTWVISAFIAYVPVIINWILERRYIYSASDSCSINLLNPTLLTIVIVSFFIPCLLMLTVYGMIFKVPRKQAARVHEMVPAVNTIHEQAMSSRASVRKSNKAAKTLGLITGIFLICWMPFFTVVVAEYFFPAYMTRNTFLWSFVTLIAYTNSMLNPVIYTLCNDSFRKAFTNILCKR